MRRWVIPALMALAAAGRVEAHGIDSRVGCIAVAFEGALAGISAIGYSRYGAHGVATMDGTLATLATTVSFGLSMDENESFLRSTGLSLVKAVIMSAPLWGLTLANHEMYTHGAHADTVFWSNFVGLNLTVVYWAVVVDRWPVRHRH